MIKPEKNRRTRGMVAKSYVLMKIKFVPENEKYLLGSKEDNER